MPKFNTKIDFIPVPRDFIENTMLLANGAYVKVYLYALSLAMRCGEMTNADIAEKMNLLESDVVKAFEYWNKEGILKYDKENVIFCGAEITVTEQENNHISKKSMSEIAEEMTSNKALADLCTLAQEILGKPLKNKDLETLYWFYDELGLSPEVITVLLEYCVSKGKRNMNYIEKVAISWHENSIVTLGAADKYMTEEKEKGGYFHSLKKLFGFEDRNFTKTEETYLTTWRDEYGMNEDMVGLAYEYCIMQINKMSYPYMHSIIKRWHEMGIHTVPEAEKDHEEFKSKNRRNNLEVFDDKNTDYDEIEKIMREKMS